MAEIRNPNQQGGGQDTKSILAFSILFVLLFLGLQFFMPKKSPESKGPETKGQEPASHAPAPAASSAPQPGTAASGSSQPQAAPAAVDTTAVQAASETKIVVENELYRITFTNRGAQVTSWVLKKYKDDDGRPLDLVNPAAAAKYGYPLSLFTYDKGLTSRLDQALFRPSATGTITAPGTLSFEYAQGGLKVHKAFQFDSTYVIKAEVAATQNGSPVTALLAWPAGFGDQQTLPQYASANIDIFQNGKSDQFAVKKVSGGNTLHGPFDWAGVSDLYFTAVFLPDDPQNTDLVTFHNTIQIPHDPRHPEPNATDTVSVLGAAIGDTGGVLRTRVFAGPKSLDVLASIHAVSGPNLENVVSFGFWRFVSKPLFLALRFLYEHVVANWGWAILVFTVILNLAMLPTRVQMMKSSLKMQRIQPQMEAIKQRYAKFKATDPRKQDMQREIMDLQKKEGVNMFGGCLPMLIQWPLLLAFYRMLTNTIELRQAHWLWLPDLAAPDPWHILPIFVILSMFLMQFFTPSPGVDQSQQRMMAFTMPAVFGFMMWNVGSGIALYWACGNFIGVLQQLVMNQTGLGREMRAIAAKRAAKRLKR